MPDDPSLRILTVDDDEVVQRYLGGLLSRRGRVERAYDGATSVDMFTKALDQGDPYDLVVMDIMMPGMDGLEATRAMTALMDGRCPPEGRRPRIAMLSCLTDPEHMLKAQYECGADAYLTKPMDASTLEETLAGLDLIPNPVDEEGA